MTPNAQHVRPANPWTRPATARLPSSLWGEIAVDLFAGGGGMSLAWEVATGRTVDEAVNHDADAIWMHQANHKMTRHWRESVWAVDPREVAAGRPVGWLHASPDCTHHSVARGGKPVRKDIRGLAWVVLKWVAALRPRLITLENVREFQGWGPVVQKRAGRGRWLWEVTRPGTRGRAVRVTVEGPHMHDGAARGWAAVLTGLGYAAEPLQVPDKRRAGQTFDAWAGQLRELGYEVDRKVLDAADFGAPTHRRRLFIVARRDGRRILWPEVTHGKRESDGEARTGASEAIGCGQGRGPTAGEGRNASDERRPRGRYAYCCVRNRGRTAGDTGGEQGKLEPYRTAAECIDFDAPCPSIFTRPRPLADNTQRRIARGLQRFVLDAAEPFVVQVNHGRDAFRGQRTDRPFPTVSSKHGYGLITPYFVDRYGERPGQDPRARRTDVPLGTVTGTANAANLVSPYLVRCAHGEACRDGRPRWGTGELDALAPLPTLTGTKDFAVSTPLLVQTGNTGGNGGYARDVGRPLGTLVSKSFDLLVRPLALPFLVGAGGRSPEPRDAARPLGTVLPKDAPSLVAPLAVKFFRTGRCKPVDAPADTITGRDRFGLCSVFLAKHYGGDRGNCAGRTIGVDRPIGTVTASDHHSLCTAWLTKLYGTSTAADVGGPAPTVTASNHLYLTHALLCPTADPRVNEGFWRVYAFLVRWLGPDAPLPIVTVGGQQYLIYDLGMRMLAPRELLNAQFSPELAAGYVLTGTRECQVAKIGNSVPPLLGAAVIRANWNEAEGEVAA